LPPLPATPVPTPPMPAVPPGTSAILPVHALEDANANEATNNVVADRKLVRSSIRPPVWGRDPRAATAHRPRASTVKGARDGGKRFSRTYTQIVTREIAITVDG
jgi:hypothetical protein